MFTLIIKTKKYMKKLQLAFAGLSFLLVSFNLHAQSKTGADYFAGTWNVLVKGLPDGDTKMFFVLEKKDTTMAGAVQDSTGKEIAKVSKTDLNAEDITVYFTAQGYDVTMLMKKKDDDHVTGSMMGMFDAEGERVRLSK
jgi:hypothetical protein